MVQCQQIKSALRMVLDDALRQQKSKPKAGVAAGAGSTGTDRWQIMKLTEPPSSGSVFFAFIARSGLTL